jgi:hypothetical protein
MAYKRVSRKRHNAHRKMLKRRDMIAIRARKRERKRLEAVPFTVHDTSDAAMTGEPI